jgi:hypothetical protein
MKYRGILSITSFVEDLPLKRKSKHQWQWSTFPVRQLSYFCQIPIQIMSFSSRIPISRPSWTTRWNRVGTSEASEWRLDLPFYFVGWEWVKAGDLNIGVGHIHKSNELKKRNLSRLISLVEAMIKITVNKLFLTMNLVKVWNQCIHIILLKKCIWHIIWIECGMFIQ